VTEKVDLQEFVGGFIAESEQLVASATAGLLEIERANAKGELRPKTVRDVFRALHTLKGLAGMMGVQPMVELAHAFETVVRAADQSGGRLGARAVELGLVAIRGIAERVRAVAMKAEVAPAPEALLDELSRVDAAGGSARAKVSLASEWDAKLGEGERQQVTAAVAAGKKIYSLTFTPSEARSAHGVSIATVRAALMTLGELVKVLPRALPQSPDSPAGLAFDMLVVSTADPKALAETAYCPVDQVTTVAAAEPAPALLPIDEIAPVSIGRSFVRVELARLDELQDQLSALVVSRFRLERQLANLAASGADIRALREIVDLQARQLRDLRRGILRARMVRVAEVLEPLWLLVRSLVQPGIKEARLELDVNDSELDKAVADRLLPAIVHLVRNAVDHAIEPISERERAGKPRVGSVRIACRERAGNQLELEVSDDGRGIDREAIARRAGRSVADHTELLDVLATPGFSTRDKATQTSGRGYGMDIVRRVAVQELGGELRVATEPNEGTKFTLQVPLTIAIIDVFSFECARQAFVVPVAAVEEIFELSDHVRIEGPRAAKDKLPITICERRGRPVPIVPLGTLLQIDPTAERASKALVIRRNGEPLAFAVDRMLGRHEVVVRPIDDVLARAPGIAGATDLGDGRPTLLLDLVELGAGISAWRAEAS
jgi:two-component system chemotaxis sensor kinase CheA